MVKIVMDILRHLQEQHGTDAVMKERMILQLGEAATDVCWAGVAAWRRDGKLVLTDVQKALEVDARGDNASVWRSVEELARDLAKALEGKNIQLPTEALRGVASTNIESLRPPDGRAQVSPRADRCDALAVEQPDCVAIVNWDKAYQPQLETLMRLEKHLPQSWTQDEAQAALAVCEGDATAAKRQLQGVSGARSAGPSRMGSRAGTPRLSEEKRDTAMVIKPEASSLTSAPPPVPAATPTAPSHLAQPSAAIPDKTRKTTDDDDVAMLSIEARAYAIALGLKRVLRRQPVRRATIYADFTKLFIEHEARKPGSKFAANVLVLEGTAFAEQLALLMVEENVSKIVVEPSSTLFNTGEGIFDRFVGNEPELRVAARAAAPVRFQGAVLTFVHKTVQEYLCAVGLQKGARAAVKPLEC